MVSAEFAKSLESVVPSGSLTGGAVVKARRFARHVEDIQLTLSALGAAGMVEAGTAAMQHGETWLTNAWTANGNPEKLADASREFIKMLVSLAMAALSYIGAKGNYGNALKIANSMPTGGLPALAVVGGGQMGGAGAHAGVLIGPSTGSMGVGGAMMSKAEEESGSESANASKAKEPKPKAEGAAPSESPPVSPVRKPAPRHTLKKVTQGSVAKELNTVVEPRVNVAEDVEAISEGKAVAGMTPMAFVRTP